MDAARRLILVSDISPILNLAAVGKLYLLRDLYAEIVVPLPVLRESVSGGAFRERIPRAMAQSSQDASRLPVPNPPRLPRTQFAASLR